MRRQIFGGEVQGRRESRIFPKLAPLSRRNRARVRLHFEQPKPLAPASVHEVLEQVLSDSRVDTIYIVAFPMTSARRRKTILEVLAEIEPVHTERGIRIHSIALGRHSLLLRLLARQTGGEYVYVD